MVALSCRRTAWEDDFGGALDGKERSVRRVAEHGVVAAGGCEGQAGGLVPAGARRARSDSLDRVGAVDDGLVGGVRQALAPAVGRGPQRGGEDEPAPAVDGRHGLDDVTVGDRPELELPFGEGAGLVEAQHVHASERLEDAGVADEDAFRRETPAAPDCATVARNGSPSGTAAAARLTPVEIASRARSAAQQRDARERRARGEDERHCSARDVIEPRLDAGHGRGGTVCGHATRFGAIAGRDDDGFGATGRDRGAGIHDRCSLRDRGVGRDRVDVLCDGE